LLLMLLLLLVVLLVAVQVLLLPSAPAQAVPSCCGSIAVTAGGMVQGFG
jgi:hypothetical protein